MDLVGPSWINLGAVLAILWLCWSIIELCSGYLAILGPCWSYVGRSYVGPSWAHVGRGGYPAKPILDRFSQHAKNVGDASYQRNRPIGLGPPAVPYADGHCLGSHPGRRSWCHLGPVLATLGLFWRNLCHLVTMLDHLEAILKALALS